MVTGLAILVFLNCWMTWKNHKPNKMNWNCLLYTVVTGVSVMKIQANPLVQISGSDDFYFRVMSMLHIKDKKKKTKQKRTTTKKEISATKHVASHFHNLELPQSTEHPHLSIYLNALMSNNLHTSYLLHIENTNINKISYCFTEINNYLPNNSNMK